MDYSNAHPEQIAQPVTRRQFLTACGTGLAAVILAPQYAVAQATDKIRIGAILDLSGPLQPFGMQKHRVLQMAIEEINAAGGLLG